LIPINTHLGIAIFLVHVSFTKHCVSETMNKNVAAKSIIILLEAHLTFNSFLRTLSSEFERVQGKALKKGADIYHDDAMEPKPNCIRAISLSPYLHHN
jgi:hypothetical protein